MGLGKFVSRYSETAETKQLMQIWWPGRIWGFLKCIRQSLSSRSHLKAEGVHLWEMCWHSQAMQNNCTDCTFGRNMLGTAGKHSDFIFIISDNGPFRNDPVECFLGQSELERHVLSPMLSKMPVYSKIPKQLISFSLTVWAMPHYTYFFPFN